MADEWEREKAPASRTLRKAERVFPGVTRRLAHCEAATPATLEWYTRNRWGRRVRLGTDSHRSRVRHGIDNLHLAGHWAEIGGGVLAAAYSGMRVAAQDSQGHQRESRASGLRDHRGV